jgi:predicted dehydrogenase
MEAINRRRFMKQSAKTAATIAAGAGTFNVARLGRTASDEVRVGVTGINGRGKDHIRGFLGVPGVRVVALCDVDSTLYEGAAQPIAEKQGQKPKTFQDIRKMLDDKGIDAISVATCNHWHALATIWGCQAGKDVYCEKPACHNVFEGRQMIAAARKYNRIVQIGSQGRSSEGVQKAVGLVRDGAIGEVYMARALCFKPRASIGIKPDSPVPPGLDYDIWLGPAAKRPFNANYVHYNWHWFWDFGCGDIGNQGVHQMDIARWGMGLELPVKVSSMGGRYGYKDQGETPNTQTASFIFDDGRMVVFEVRGLDTNDEDAVKIGNLFYGSEGWIALEGFQWYDHFRKGKKERSPNYKEGDHFANFVKAVRSRNYRDLNADVREGVLSADMCHLANIAYRLGRTLKFDPKTETFPDDAEATALLTRKYREPYVVPARV